MINRYNRHLKNRTDTSTRPTTFRSRPVQQTSFGRMYSSVADLSSYLGNLSEKLNSFAAIFFDPYSSSFLFSMCPEPILDVFKQSMVREETPYQVSESFLGYLNRKNSLESNLELAKELIEKVNEVILFSPNYLDMHDEILAVKKQQTTNRFDERFNEIWRKQNNLLQHVRAKASDKIAASSATDKTVFFEANILAAVAAKYNIGNCGEMTAIGFFILMAQGVWNIQVDMFILENHAILVIGRDLNSKLSDYKSWGKQAVICDPWLKKCYPASELERKLMDIEPPLSYKCQGEPEWVYSHPRNLRLITSNRVAPQDLIKDKNLYLTFDERLTFSVIIDELRLFYQSSSFEEKFASAKKLSINCEGISTDCRLFHLLRQQIDYFIKTCQVDSQKTKSS